MRNYSKTKNRIISEYGFHRGACKAWTARNTLEMFGEGVAIKVTGHRCFKKFLPGDINLQSERCDEPGL